MTINPKCYWPDDDANILPSDVRKNVFNGKIIVIRNLLQDIGLYSEIIKYSQEQIQGVIGKEQADKLGTLGFESLHKIIGSQDLIPIENTVSKKFAPLQAGYLKKIIGAIFNYHREFYYCSPPIIRFHPPFDFVAHKPELVRELKTYKGGGKLGVHDPHTDSMVKCPTNSINIWLAIGRVTLGNGFSIWPQYFGTNLNPGDHDFFKKHSLGEPINFILQPGDAVIFHGEHLHSSELNWTDKTRYAMTFRITFDPPEFSSESGHLYLHSESGEQWDNHNSIKTVDSANKLPFLPKFKDDSPFSPNLQNIQLIEAYSKDLIKVQLDDGTYVIASRYCTHEGADLCRGYVKNGKIFCPKHNLPFDLKSGKSQCASLEELRIVPQ